ncbi:MAG: Rieske 2Fe-2S domain-containing protein [Chloroflexi bacterium]|nr:Rieske 2Fe-2S domain-containing protein [Chloroflexota bacterium]
MADAVQSANSPQTTPMTRREFLYYIWGASMALFMAEFGGAFVWFLLPRFKAGEFGGIFTLDPGAIPPPDSGPAEFAAGRFWLVNLGEKALSDSRQPTDYPQTAGVKALYKVCVHLGCLYRWAPTNDRYECPCHGSKYLLSGSRIDGPARRNLDLFVVQAVDANGNVLAETAPLDGSEEGAAIQMPAGAVALRVNTGKRIIGAVNTKPGGGR